MHYKAIVCDIDGTLTKSMSATELEPLPTPGIIAAIQKAQTKVAVVVATSRPPSLTTNLLDILQLQGPCITLSGGLIINGKTKAVIREHPIAPDDFQKLMQYLQQKNYDFIIDEQDEAGIKFTPSYVPHNPLNVFVAELGDEEVKQVERELSELAHLACHKVSSWTPSKWALNISNATVSKQHAIVEVAEILGIETHEMIGVGDGHNDFPLLMACGLKVAMGNAVPELKAIADYIAPNVEEDGVADVINKFILSET